MQAPLASLGFVVDITAAQQLAAWQAAMYVGSTTLGVTNLMAACQYVRQMLDSIVSLGNLRLFVSGQMHYSPVNFVASQLQPIMITSRAKFEVDGFAQVAGEGEAAEEQAGHGAVSGEALAGALAGALELGLLATALADTSLAARGGWSLGKGSRQTKGRNLPMERQWPMGRLEA